MTKVLLTVGFVIAFGAGWIMSAGWERRQQQAQAASVPATQQAGRGGFLAAELSLTPEQQERMKKIWSEIARHGGREQGERRNQYRKERDEAIAALIRPADKDRYDAVLRAYADRQAGLEREMRSAYERAVEETKKILTPEQGRKYEEIQKKREAGGPGGGPGGPREHDQGRRVEDRATSRPGTDK
jgi:Spy/CpxP family protein refolding chaperone